MARRSSSGKGTVAAIEHDLMDHCLMRRSRPREHLDGMTGGGAFLARSFRPGANLSQLARHLNPGANAALKHT
jgi:hypothetical protein